MLRDLLLEKGLWVDVAETAVSFSNALVLWKDVKESVLDAFKVQEACHLRNRFSLSPICV